MTRLVGAFFSLLEFLLAAMYALHRTGGTYADFQKLYLHEQLRTLLPTTTDKDWDRLYNRIIQLRDNYRNPLHHGLTDDEFGVLVPFRGLGLIPISYRYLRDGLRFGYSLGVSVDEVRARPLADSAFRSNSRMKDFRDLYVLAVTTPVDGAVITRAVARTFERRGTSLSWQSTVMTDGFARDADRQAAWAGYLRKERIDSVPS